MARQNLTTALIGSGYHITRLEKQPGHNCSNKDTDSRVQEELAARQLQNSTNLV